MRRFAVMFLLLAASGCSLVHEVKQQRVSLADRCAAVLTAAMPFARIDITDRTSRDAGIDTIVADAAGTRTDLAKDTRLPRRLAVECTFYDGILSGFRWTKGGPPH